MINDPLLKSILYEEFDYQTLLDAIKGYAQPRMKISSLLAKGTIIRVKKGLYVLGESQRRQPYAEGTARLSAAHPPHRSRRSASARSGPAGGDRQALSLPTGEAFVRL